ncbi:MAG TPA: TonB-dependent receptor [Thermoanaerobaculia bacterium]|jgi:iron complex outermembrane receptor protein|nr:TonB-dependent receptor [Thermoanaerobaculia bacterium]
MFLSFILAMVIAGIVRDPAGQPIAGASVSISNIKTIETANDGSFALDMPAGTYTLTISRAGFKTEERRASTGSTIAVTLAPRIAETIVVSGIRAEATTPVTKSDLDRQQIEKQYYQQDVPLLLRDTPSINAWAESGVGNAGYSYISLRGVSPTRINFTLDGVPLADSEDMGTYFVDFPDLAHSLQSIQIQRGVGTSTVGSPSFGGSVNFESIDLAQSEQISARVAGGSFGTRFATVGYQSGFLPGGFALYTRVSANETNGFRESSGTQQRNIFFSAAKQEETSQLRITGFSGHERQHLSFYAADADTLATNLRANPLQPDERDSFGYDLANVQYLKSLESGASLTASAYYQRGYGWYRLRDTDLRQYGLDGMLIGSMLTYSQTRGSLTTSYGVHVNRFRREHTRDVVGGPRDYYNYGTKGEANAFAKASIDRSSWHFYGDAQVRYTDFRYHGDLHIDPIDWTFFNPKIGVRRDLNPQASIYVSAGISTREPTRNDMFQGEDNASFAHDLHAVRPERLFDLESGIDYRSPRMTLKANVYAMEFRNEIASTGELSDIGLLLRRNVDRSYRRGIEIDAALEATSTLRLRTIANLSRNRIGTWTQFYDVYDSEGNFIGSKPIVYHDVEPVLTPSAIVNEALEYTPSSSFSAGVVGRWVGRSFLDNTDNRDFVTPSWFSLDGNVSVAMSRWSRLSLQVNNILNRKRLYANGYDYIFFTNDRLAGTAYYFPQATRNFVVMVDVRM